MKPDRVLSWDQHLKNGNVWKVNVELSMQFVDIYVVAPTQHLLSILLLQCILITIFVRDDEPTRTAP